MYWYFDAEPEISVSKCWRCNLEYDSVVYISMPIDTPVSITEDQIKLYLAFK